MSHRVHVYSIMHNEIKILPYFLRHYESFADKIFVWDEACNDGTREMLESHSMVTVFPLNIGKLDDLYFVKNLWPQYRQSRGDADWVICVDADEFVYHPNITEKLEGLKLKGISKVRCQGYQMYSSEFPKTQGQIYDEVRLGSLDLESSTKTILFDPNIKIKWSLGRHHCSREKFSASDTGIILLHFRLLGYDYYIEKMKKRLRDSAVHRRVLASRLAITPEKFEEYKGQYLTEVLDLNFGVTPESI